MYVVQPATAPRKLLSSAGRNTILGPSKTKERKGDFANRRRTAPGYFKVDGDDSDGSSRSG